MKENKEDYEEIHHQGISEKKKRKRIKNSTAGSIPIAMDSSRSIKVYSLSVLRVGAYRWGGGGYMYDSYTSTSSQTFGLRRITFESG
jgi:hypothetical protein